MYAIFTTESFSPCLLFRIRIRIVLLFLYVFRLGSFYQYEYAIVYNFSSYIYAGAHFGTDLPNALREMMRDVLNKFQDATHVPIDLQSKT